MLDENAPVLFDLPAAEMPSIRINSRGLRPGVTPPRFAGRPAAVLPSLAVGGGNDKVKSQSAQAPSTRPNHDCVRLWSQMALDQVAANLRAGIVKSDPRYPTLPCLLFHAGHRSGRVDGGRCGGIRGVRQAADGTAGIEC
jgi:hypothetical protein